VSRVDTLSPFVEGTVFIAQPKIEQRPRVWRDVARLRFFVQSRDNLLRLRFVSARA